MFIFVTGCTHRTDRMGQLTFAFLLYVMCLWTSMQTVNGAVCYAYSTLLNHIYSFYCGDVCCDSHSPGHCCKSVNRRSYYYNYYDYYDNYNYYNNYLYYDNKYYYYTYYYYTSSSGLSAGQITGIVFGCIAGLGFLLSLIGFCCAKCNGKNTVRPANQQTLRPATTWITRNAATQSHTTTAGQPPPYNLSTFQTVRGPEQLPGIGGRVPETPLMNSGIIPEQPQATAESVPEQETVTRPQLPPDDFFDSTVP